LHTNFDTFIDTENPSQLPQRGHAKSKRSDLRIVGLALLVSLDFHVPLLWKVYPGNPTHSVTFVQILEELTQRYQALARDCQSITLVFDKGNNSARNPGKFSTAVVSILSAPWYRRTLPTCWLSRREISAAQRPPLETHPGLASHAPGLGTGTHVAAYLQSELQRKQIRGIQQHLAKKRRALRRAASQAAALRKSPGPKAKGIVRKSLWKQVQKICSGQHIAKILHVAVSKVRGQLQLSYRTDVSAFTRIKEQHLGKRIPLYRPA